MFGILGIAVCGVIGFASWWVDLHYKGLGFLSWLLAISSVWLVFLLHAVKPSDLTAKPLEASTKEREYDAIAMIFLMLLSLTTRLSSLEYNPPRFDADEARQANHALYIAECFFKSGCMVQLLGSGWNNLPNVSYLPATLGLSLAQLADINFIVAARSVSAAIGTLAILLLFILFRSFLSSRESFCATTLLVCNRHALEWSRLGTSNIQAQITLLLFLLALRNACIRKTSSAWFLFGVAAAFGAYAYHAAKILVLLGPIIGMTFLVFSNRTRVFSLFSAFSCGWSLVLVPAICTQLATGFSGVLLNDRTLQDDILVLLMEGKYAELWQLFLAQATRSSLGIFLEDGTLPFGYSGPLLDPLSALLLLVGAICMWRSERPFLLTLLTCAGSILFVGGLLTINPLHHPRLLGLSTSLLIIAGFSVQLLRTGGLAAYTALAVIVTTNLYNLKNEFFDLPLQQEDSLESQRARHLGSILLGERQFLADKPIAFLGTPSSDPEAFALRFYNIAAYDPQYCQQNHNFDVRSIVLPITEKSDLPCLRKLNCENESNLFWVCRAP